MCMSVYMSECVCVRMTICVSIHVRGRVWLKGSFQCRPGNSRVLITRSITGIPRLYLAVLVLVPLLLTVSSFCHRLSGQTRGLGSSLCLLASNICGAFDRASLCYLSPSFVSFFFLTLLIGVFPLYMCVIYFINVDVILFSINTKNYSYYCCIYVLCQKR